MSSLEFHSWHGHKGYHPGCRVCELVARSLKRTYVDKVIFHELRFGYRFTMDAIVFSHRSYRGRKYAYTYMRYLIGDDAAEERHIRGMP